MDEVKKFAVFGNPISHSLSPMIHKEFAKEQKLNIQYKAIEPESDDFETHAQSFFSKKGIGANVTIPFKDQAYNFADEKDEVSTICQCSNTLWYDDGKIKAFNTDGQGFINDLKKKNIIMRDMKILILGTGGSARSIINTLSSEDVKSISILSRSQDNVDKIIEKFDKRKKISHYSDSDSYGLVINTTPISMTNSEIPFPESIINNNTISYDLFYSRKQTRFQEWSLNKGASQALDGIGMLINQAALSYEIWNKFSPDTERVEQLIRSL